MNTHIVLLAAFSLLLSACGNRGDLMLRTESPPEDARRYLIKPKPEAASESTAQPESSDDDDDR